MKTSFNSLILVVLTSIVFVGCSAKGRGKYAKMPEAVAKLESKSSSGVSGALQFEDHYGGVLVTGKLAGLEPKKAYKVEVRQGKSCDAAGSILVALKPYERKEGTTVEVIGADGEVTAYAAKYSTAGKNALEAKMAVVSLNGKILACGKVEATKCTHCGKAKAACAECNSGGKCTGKSCKDGKCCDMKADCKCGGVKADCKCAGMKADCKCAGKSATKSSGKKCGCAECGQKS